MPPLREISIANRHPRLRLDRRAITRALHLLDTSFAPRAPLRSKKSEIENPKSKIPEGELSIVFLTDPALARLHADFLADPTVTDVITFEGDPLLGTAGEICLSPDAALRHLGPKPPALSSKSNGSPKLRRSDGGKALDSAATTAAFSTELTLYLIHGWLHLAGYDDLEPAKKRLMRRAEARALRLLRTSDAIPEFRLR